MKAIVAEGGQVTIPKPLRQKLGIRAGTILEFEVNDSMLIAIKADAKDAVGKVYGCLGQLETDSIMKLLRKDKVKNKD